MAYVWNPSERWRVGIGLPLSVTWRPTEGLTVTLSYVPLTNVNALAGYRAAPRVHLYGGYRFLTESYFLADRASARDRFMGFEQRLIGGARRDAGRHAVLDLSGGYAFDRHDGEGRNQGGVLHNRVDVAAGAFLGASVRARF